MSVKNVALLLLLWLLPIISSAQKLEFNGECLLFREAKTKQPVLIVNDSLVYKGFAMKRIAFKHTEYPAKLQDYKFFNIGSKTYLVHDGCGPVLEFRNDSIVRIDKSFLHRNQFGASHFVYRNEIYFYGGYGLFTFKNILTKFDFTNGEWIEVQTFGESEQVPRAFAFSFAVQNELYICSGITKDSNHIPKRLTLDNKVWRLNMTSMKWSCIGQLTPVINSNKLTFYDFISNNGKIYFLYDTFSEIDVKENSISNFDSKFYSGFSSVYSEGNTFVGIIKDNNSKKKSFKVFSLNRYKGKFISKSMFIEPLDYDYRIIIGLIVFLTFSSIIIFFFWQKIRNKWMPFTGVVYNEKKKQFLYKSKLITIFDEQEKRLLLYLLEQNNHFISLNNLNQLFENNNQPETISATVKRREQVVFGLLVKVSKVTGIEQQKLILERKNSEDKRIKDILLLPGLLKKEA
jgi:hypothetical protein